MNKKIKKTTIVLIILVLINIVNQSFYKRMDLTNDQRYTLSETTKKTVQRIEQPLFINVYLEGDFPSSRIFFRKQFKIMFKVKTRSFQKAFRVV